MISGFKNVRMYVDGKIKKQSLSIKNGKICDFEKLESHISLPKNLILVPGFIDEHTHGSNGYDAMDGEEVSLLNISKNLAKEGTTSFLATTMTQEKNAILKSLKNINEYMKKNISEGASLLGVHLEGPFISKVYKGAQPENAIIKCDVELFTEFNKASGNNIKLVTMAYEENGRELLEYLVSHGITASLGHTNATSNEALEAISLGAHCATHTFNAMKGLHHREAGTLGACLLEDKVYCELIADLIHISPNAIKLLFKCKTADKVIAITDAMEAKNLEDGKYQLGGQDVYVKDGSARLIDGTLAGSILRLNEGLRNINKNAGVKFEDCIKIATINPAKNIGVSHIKGSIAIGKDADFAVIDEDFNVYLTIREGKIIYKNMEL